MQTHLAVLNLPEIKDSGYYSKCFRKKYNQSPREYMNEWRKGER